MTDDGEWLGWYAKFSESEDRRPEPEPEPKLDFELSRWMSKNFEPLRCLLGFFRSVEHRTRTEQQQFFINIIQMNQNGSRFMVHFNQFMSLTFVAQEYCQLLVTNKINKIWLWRKHFSYVIDPHDTPYHNAYAEILTLCTYT